MHYRIFDFSIESEVALPAHESLASRCDLGASRWPLEIVFRPRNNWHFRRASLIGRTFWSRAYDVGDGLLISSREGISMYFHGDGSRIEAHFNPACSRQKAFAGLKLINMGLGVCHLLRGALPLHGASVEQNSHLFCVMAPSGTGKSTLLWRLLDGGALFGSDDLLPVFFDASGITATPSISLSGKLSGDALEKRGLSRAEFEEVMPGADEFWIPIAPELRTVHSSGPRALFILSPYVAAQAGATEQPLFVERCPPGDALTLLLANTQGLWAASAFLDSRELMANALRLAGEIPIFTLHYARDFAVLPRVRDALSHLVSQIVFTP